MAYSGKQSFSGSYAIRDLWTYMLRFIVDSGYWSIVHSDFASGGTDSYLMSDDISVTALDTWLDLSSTDAYGDGLTESMTGESVGTGDGTTTSFSHTTSHTPIPNPGSPIALYKFDGNADDSMGNYNGTATDVTYGTGKFGQAAVFNGSSSYIENASLSSGNNSAMSFSFWANLSGSEGDLIGFNLGNGNTDASIQIPDANGTCRVYIRTKLNYTDVSNFFIINNTWHHYVIVIDENGTSHYRDGALVAITGQTMSNFDAPIQIGSGVNGSIDQVYIFNKALTDAEVQALYKNSSIQLSYTIGGTVYSGQDDLSGNITGTDLSGTVDYPTGAIDLTYTTAPDNTTAITMDYSYDLVVGTDYEINNNLGRVKFLSTGQVQVNDTVHADYTWKREYIIFYSTGISGTEKIYIGAMPYINSDGVHGYVQWKAYKYWQEGMSFTDTTLGTTYNSFGFALWNSDTDFWLFVNQQRVIAVSCIQTVYNSAYAGFFNRFAMPHEYNYPLCVITSDDTSMSYDSTSGDREFIPNSHRVNFMQEQNVWEDFTSSHTSLLPIQQDTGYLVEMHYPTGANRALLPIYIYYNGNIYGQLDGVYFNPGDVNSSESEITVNGDTYIVFEDVFRHGWNQFMAVKED